jgi:hypothetical protein
MNVTQENNNGSPVTSDQANSQTSSDLSEAIAAFTSARAQVEPVATATEVQEPIKEDSTKEPPAGAEAATVSKEDESDVAEMMKTRERFELLTKQERKARAARERFEQEKKEFEAQRQSMVSKEEILAQLRANPTKFAEENGLSMDDVVRFHLSNNGKDPEYKIKQLENGAIKEMKEKLENFEKMFKSQKEEQEKAVESKAVSTYQNTIKSFITENQEKYPFTADVDNVQAEIYKAWDLLTAQGQKITIPEIAEQFEKHFRQQFEKAFDKPSIKRLAEEKLGLSKQVKEQKEQNPFFTLSSAIPTGVPQKDDRDKFYIPSDKETIEDAVKAFMAAQSGRN